MPPTAPPGIPPEASTFFADLLAEAPRSPAELRAELRAHVESIQAAAHDNELLDASLALALANTAEALLAEAEARDSDDVRTLVQAAVRYFILDDDAEPDLSSVCGLDDDAHVCNAVARHLGRDDLLIRI